MRRFIAILFCLPLLAATAVAADLPVKAPPKASILTTYYGHGWYFGVHTYAENDRISGTTTGGVLGGTFAVGAAVGATAGYMWGDGVSFKAIEAMASYKNISATALTTAGDPTSIDSKWGFTQRVKWGGPIATVLDMLPNLSTIFPAFPTVPAGGTGTTHPYIFGALHEDDISSSIGLSVGRAWRVKGGFGVGVMQQLGATQSNPQASRVVMDVWAEYVPPGSSMTFGAGDLVGTTNLGRETRIGMSILY